MKFNDAYRRANDSVHVRESLKSEIQAEYEKETAYAPQKRENRRRWLVAIPTAATAMAAVFLAVFVGLRTGIAKNSAPKAAQDMVMAESTEDSTARNEAKGMPLAQAAGAADAGAPLPVDSYETLHTVMEERDEAVCASRKGDVFYAADIPAAGEAPAPDAVPMPTGAPSTQIDSAVNTENITESDDENASGTNNQVANVDEADIVKTDGTWIYDLNTKTNKLYVLSAAGEGTAVQVAADLTKDPDDGACEYREMILANDRLYVIAVVYDWNAENAKDCATTVTEVYALNDRQSVSRIATLRQDGFYQTARLVGNTLVIVSWYDVYAIDRDDVPADWCPGVAVDGESRTLRPNELYVNPNSNRNSFAVVTTTDTETDVRFESTSAVLGGCHTVYCSDTELLIASAEGEHIESEEQTDENGSHFVTITNRSFTGLYLFRLVDGKAEPAASTRIEGRLLNQFSMDACDGTYRFVVSRSASVETIHTDGIDTYEWDSKNDCALYVLDETLEPLGAVENLAENELVQSVRFMGSVVYFVTFRQTDPLFAVDLSDPETPQILSELKISGFSAYLHPFGEGRLLGIGYEADEQTGRITGVKVALYDISDPTDVKEILRQSVKAEYTNVAQNHKGVYVDAKSGTFAFPAENKYFVLRVTDTNVALLGTVDAGDMAWDGSIRGLSIGGAFYVVSPDAVTVLSFDAMQKLTSVPLN
jgi:uncharacterized secreted protein with C-terminal beta-propeller domain